MPRTEAPPAVLGPAATWADFRSAFGLVRALADLDARLCAPLGFPPEMILSTYYPPSPAALRVIYAPPQGRLLLMRIGGRATGCAGYTGDGSLARLRHVFLRPAHRGGGRGRRLVEAALAAARADGYREIRLVTIAPMAAAIGLYRSLGFRDCAPSGDHAGTGTAAIDIHMSRPL
ncbi:MAG: GNAT family N-acetyltransferase [Rhodobacteraceae bacterium]|nr:GNAT family N-acetyltransferase [Paracoccaceae bacterium]